MRKVPFIWLGSGRASRRNVARKGMLLDQAARSGLPVPSGGILLDDFYQICVTEGVAKLSDNAVLIPDPIWLQQVLFRDIRFPRLEGAAAIRSASSLNEGKGQPVVSAQLSVDLDDPSQLTDALELIWSNISSDSAVQKHDVLVMEMVKIETAGEALSIAEMDCDQVRLDVGEELEISATFDLEKISTFQRASVSVPAYAKRLQKLLRGFRRSFGKGDWRIEWADDGEICWLIQIY